MKISGTVAFIIIGLVFSIWPAKTQADAIDDAEAKRRGVPVEVVQLEAAKARIASLEKQLMQAAADLAKAQADKVAADKKVGDAVVELEKLKAAMTSEQKDNVAKAYAVDQAKSDQQAGVAKAIKEHKLVNGMTVDQANESLALKIKFRKISESSYGEVWVAAISTQAPFKNIGGGRIAGGQTTGTKYTLQVKDGWVFDWSSEPFTMEPGSGQSM